MAKDQIDVKTIEAALDAASAPIVLPPREAEIIRNALGLQAQSYRRAMNTEKDVQVRDIRVKQYNEVMLLISRVQ